MAAYLTVAEFRQRTVMPQADVDNVEVTDPGFIAAQLESLSSRIDSQLRKRYAFPFSAPVPEVVLDWLTRLTTPRVYLKRGVNPSDAQIDAVFSDVKVVTDEIQAAADAEKGLFDLPLSQTSSASGVSKGGTLATSDASPYAWTDRQRTKARREDR